MRTLTTARLSSIQTGALQLGTSVRGMIYGIALIGAAPLAWTAGRWLPALLVGAIALLGIGVEAAIYSRRDTANRIIRVDSSPTSPLAKSPRNRLPAGYRIRR